MEGVRTDVRGCSGIFIVLRLDSCTASSHSLRHISHTSSDQNRELTWMTKLMISAITNKIMYHLLLNSEYSSPRCLMQRPRSV